jgi:hypothetical protein
MIFYSMMIYENAEKEKHFHHTTHNTKTYCSDFSQENVSIFNSPITEGMLDCTSIHNRPSAYIAPDCHFQYLCQNRTSKTLDYK